MSALRPPDSGIPIRHPNGRHCITDLLLMPFWIGYAIGVKIGERHGR